jgi:hypothetical protein
MSGGKAPAIVPILVNGDTLGLNFPFSPTAFTGTSFLSCAASPHGLKVYLGRSNVSDPTLLNLVVGTLDSSGNVVGTPRLYPSSAAPLNPISDPLPSSHNHASVCAIVVNSAANRLYMGDERSDSNGVPSLNVYTLDGTGEPTGAVRNYDVTLTHIRSMVQHPTLPKLYATGPFDSTVTTISLDASGEPTLPATQSAAFGTVKNGTIGVSADGKHLYLGTHPDVLEIVDLDPSGNVLSASFRAFPFSNAAVGRVKDYLCFVVGTHAIYTPRPNPSGPGLPILGLWPLDATTGDPIGSALARTDIHPPLIANTAMSIGLDNAHNRLWVASPNTFVDAFSGKTCIDGITPISYTITGTGTLSATGTAAPPLPLFSNVAIVVPPANAGRPIYMNFPITTVVGNRTRGWQVRATITAATNADGSDPFPMRLTLYPAKPSEKHAPIALGGLAINTPSAWINVDPYLHDKSEPEPFRIGTPDPYPGDYFSGPVTALMTVTIEVAKADGTLLKALTESVHGPVMGFVLPTYGMSQAALGVPTGTPTGIKTFAQHTAGYLATARVVAVAPADRPIQLIINCNNFVPMVGSVTALTNLAQTVQHLGFNTANAHDFSGLPPTTVNSILNAHGLPWRSLASGSPGAYSRRGLASSGSLFDFDGEIGIWNATSNTIVPNSGNLRIWVDAYYKGVGATNTSGASLSQIVDFVLADEPVWYYPGTVLGPPAPGALLNGYTPKNSEFQGWLQHTKGLTPATFGQANWTPIVLTMQSTGNPMGSTAPLLERQLYYWTTRYFAESSANAMLLAQQAVTSYMGHALFTPVNWNNWTNAWYTNYANVCVLKQRTPDNAYGQQDWQHHGRISAHTLWSEDAFHDQLANLWSVYAAGLRSASQGGTQAFGSYVTGRTLGNHPAGGKYKVFALLGNGAKEISAYCFGPFVWGTDDGWSDNTPAYKAYADAFRLAGRSESLVNPGVPDRGQVAIVYPGTSDLWNQEGLTSLHYYNAELYGLYLAISHSWGCQIDFIDDTDIANGLLTTNDYWAIYVAGPNVAAAAQAQIATWLTTHGSHARTLCVLPGAGVADEYNTATTTFDGLLGLTPGSRAAVRAMAYGGVPISDPAYDLYTATVQTLSSHFHWSNQTTNVRGPVRGLTLAVGGGATADMLFTDPAHNGQHAMTSRTVMSGTANTATAYGFFPGYQYFTSPHRLLTHHLPQNWSPQVREFATMPVTRALPPLHVRLSGNIGPGGMTLTAAQAYQNTAAIEALRLTSGTSAAVVLLNWGDAPVSSVTVNVLGSYTYVTVASSGVELTPTIADGHTTVSLPLTDVEVLMCIP